MAGFDDWYNNPISQIGLGLLANTRAESPLAGAMNQLSAFQAAKAKRAYEQAQIERLGAQTSLERQQEQSKALQDQRAMALQERQQAMMELIQNNPEFASIFGGGQTQPQTPPPPQSSAPTAPPPGVNPFNGMPTTHDVVGQTAPRGIRNNNPGNLKPKGEFAVYPDMQTGWKALDDNLLSYHKMGLNTISRVINRWAPPSENNTASYIQDVSQRLGVDPNASIDLSNPQVRQALGAAIAIHENGPQIMQAQQQAPAPAQPPAPGLTPDKANKLGLALSFMPGMDKAGTGLFKYAESLQPKMLASEGYMLSPSGERTWVEPPAASNKRQQEERRINTAEIHAANDTARTIASTDLANKPLTEAQGKAAAYVQQMGQAEQTLKTLQDKGWDMGSFRSQVEVSLAGGLANPAVSAAAQQAKQIQEQWTEAYLRFKTGAATNASEIERNRKTFFPSVGDKSEVILQKARARLDAMEAVRKAAGRQAGGESAPPALNVGDVRGGYKYKGGDPASKSNWEKQ